MDGWDGGSGFRGEGFERWGEVKADGGSNGNAFGTRPIRADRDTQAVRPNGEIEKRKQKIKQKTGNGKTGERPNGQTARSAVCE